jgi:fimbrial chaperone protein
MKLLARLTAFLLLSATAAHAASLLVRPTTVIFGPGESAATVTVTNNGNAPLTAQLRLFAWDQQQNQDKLEATGAVVASPPMLEIPAGQSQTIRLVRVLSVPAKGQENYRLLVDEIPNKAAIDAGTGVVVQLRYSVPVFVMPKKNESANATVKASLNGGSLVLDIANRGRAHAQVSNVRLAYADGSTAVIGAGLVGYVLPDKQRQWQLELPSGPASGVPPTRVRAQINGKDLLVAL